MAEWNEPLSTSLGSLSESDWNALSAGWTMYGASHYVSKLRRHWVVSERIGRGFGVFKTKREAMSAVDELLDREWKHRTYLRHPDTYGTMSGTQNRSHHMTTVRAHPRRTRNGGTSVVRHNRSHAERGARFHKGERVYVTFAGPREWFKKPGYGTISGANNVGGMFLQDRQGTFTVGEWAYLVEKSPRGGALWYSAGALRAVRGRERKVA